MERNQRLIDEVNKLIKSILASDKSVTLPAVGRLSVGEEESLSFSKEEGDTTIVNKIASMGNCTEAQAEQIYNKWKEEITRDGAIEIEGIGTIRGEEFSPVTPVESAEEKPQEEQKEEAKPKYIPRSQRAKSEEPKKKKGWAKYLFLALLCGVAYLIISLFVNKQSEQVTIVEQTTMTETIVEEQSCVEESVATQEAECNIVEETACEQPKRYRVVCGVFNRVANAERMVAAIGKTTAQNETLQGAVELKMHPRYDGYMVVVFESEGFRPCVDFIKQYKGVVCDSMWIYDHKKM